LPKKERRESLIIDERTKARDTKDQAYAERDVVYFNLITQTSEGNAKKL